MILYACMSTFFPSLSGIYQNFAELKRGAVLFLQEKLNTQKWSGMIRAMIESPSNDMRTCIKPDELTMEQLKLGTSKSLLPKKCQKHVENIPLLSSCGRAICWQDLARLVALWWPWCVTLTKLDAPTIWFPSTAALPSSVATSASAFGGLTAKKQPLKPNHKSAQSTITRKLLICIHIYIYIYTILVSTSTDQANSHFVACPCLPFTICILPSLSLG